MCGRYTFSSDSESDRIRRIQTDLTERNISFKTGQVFPGDVAAVIASSRALVPRVFAMKWGYTLSGGKLVFNARSESAPEKPLFCDGMKQRRCLIPADSYFEWAGTDRKKQKYEIAPRDGPGFFLAGIYRPQGEFSILTREPGESIAFIHDRMPVILPESAASAWLDPRRDGREILQFALQDMQFAPCP